LTIFNILPLIFVAMTAAALTVAAYSNDPQLTTQLPSLVAEITKNLPENVSKDVAAAATGQTIGTFSYY
jgi:hypothetical protein